jgi:hypothetical protein
VPASSSPSAAASTTSSSPRSRPRTATMGSPHPVQSARLWIALVVEAAPHRTVSKGRSADAHAALEHFLPKGATA